MNQMVKIETAASPFGTILRVDDPERWSADPGQLAQLRALVHSAFVVVVELPGIPIPDVVGRIAAAFGYPPGPWPINPVPGRAAVPRYGFMTDIDEPQSDGPRDVSWLEGFHTDGQSAYTVVGDFAGTPFGPNRYRDMAAIYADLSPELQRILRGRNAVHGASPKIYALLDASPPIDPETAPRLPLVVRHPRSGVAVLRLPRHPQATLEGLPPEEGREVLAALWAQVERSEHRFENMMGSTKLYVWDGIRLAHTNPLFDRTLGPRRQWFFTIDGDWPRLEPY